MQSSAKPTNVLSVKIEDFGDMQARYSAMPIADCASAVLADAGPALGVAEQLLGELSAAPKIKEAIKHLRKSDMLIGRLRASEAKSALIDDSVDFLQVTSSKMAAWCVTLKRIAGGEGKASVISKNAPASGSMVNLSNYLSIVKLIVSELSKIDNEHSAHYASMLVELRRCATLLSDCECASNLSSVILH